MDKNCQTAKLKLPPNKLRIRYNHYSNYSNYKSEYSDLLSDFSLVQHVTNQSPVSTHSVTLIDHVVSSAALCITQSTQMIGASYHRIQTVDFNLPVCKRNPGVIWVHLFKKCDRDQVQRDLVSAPWGVMSVYDD